MADDRPKIRILRKSVAEFEDAVSMRTQVNLVRYETPAGTWMKTVLEVVKSGVVLEAFGDEPARWKLQRGTLVPLTVLSGLRDAVDAVLAMDEDEQTGGEGFVLEEDVD